MKHGLVSVARYPLSKASGGQKFSERNGHTHNYNSYLFILPEPVSSKAGLPFTRLEAVMRRSLVTFSSSLRLCYITAEYQGEMERRVKAVMLCTYCGQRRRLMSNLVMMVGRCNEWTEDLTP